jgi:hypothetical protein
VSFLLQQVNQEGDRGVRLVETTICGGGGSGLHGRTGVSKFLITTLGAPARDRALARAENAPDMNVQSGTEGYNSAPSTRQCPW